MRTMKKYIENTMLPSSVTTRVLRIVLVESTPDAFVCLRLEAFGCITSHGTWFLHNNLSSVL